MSPPLRSLVRVHNSRRCRCMFLFSCRLKVLHTILDCRCRVGSSRSLRALARVRLAGRCAGAARRGFLDRTGLCHRFPDTGLRGTLALPGSRCPPRTWVCRSAVLCAAHGPARRDRKRRIGRCPVTTGRAVYTAVTGLGRCSSLFLLWSGLLVLSLGLSRAQSMPWLNRSCMCCSSPW